MGNQHTSENRRQAPRVTVIDDEPTMGQLVEDILRPEGVIVTSLTRAEPSLDAILDSRPDLLIVDLLLAGGPAELSGWDVVRLAKAHRELLGVPILVVSADIPQLQSRIDDAIGYDDVQLISKPFALDALLVMVRHALARVEELRARQFSWAQPRPPQELRARPTPPS